MLSWVIMTETSAWWQHLLPRGDIDSDRVNSFLLLVGWFIARNRQNYRDNFHFYYWIYILLDVGILSVILFHRLTYLFIWIERVSIFSLFSIRMSSRMSSQHLNPNKLHSLKCHHFCFNFDLLLHLQRC